MADTSEIIRSISISNRPADLVIRGGKFYVARRGVGKLSVYNYAGEHIRDQFSYTGVFSLDHKDGRFYLGNMATGADNVRIWHYDGSVDKDITVGYSQRTVRLKYGRLWVTLEVGAECREHYYDGTQIRSYATGDNYTEVEIRSGRVYFIQSGAGKLRIANKGGEEITTRGATTGSQDMRFRGGRVFLIHYGDEKLYVTNYAYFNIL